MIVMLSGGVDSALLAARAAATGNLFACMFFDYGQPVAAQERAAATAISNHLGAPLWTEVARIPGAAYAMRTGVGVSGPRIVPARNLIMLSLAAAQAASSGRSVVQFGANAADHEYPDCSPAFVGEISKLCEDSCGVSVEAPLLQTSKAEIVHEAAGLLGDALALCWSCYESNNGAPCGECNSCEANKCT